MHYRTIWISDVHLGTRGCSATSLLDFMRRDTCDHLFLVGDIIDGWRLRKGIYWPQEHNDVVQKILRKARKGCRVVYIPGNHDEVLRDYTGNSFGGVELVDSAVHVTADGRRLLVIHGDKFDNIATYYKWLALLGDWGYAVALVANRWINYWRRRCGLSYWSISAYLKHSVKQAVQFIDNYEQAIADECRRHGYDGIVCGHIHHPALYQMADGLLYANCGDWVETCSALVEHHDGRLEVLRFAETR